MASSEANNSVKSKMELHELKVLAIRVTKAVCDVNGTITRPEVERLDYLRNKHGKDYDAINCVWENYTG